VEFNTISAGIGFGLVACSMAVINTLKFDLKSAKLTGINLVWTVLLLTIAVGIYQSFLFYYASAVALCILSNADSDDGTSRYQGKLQKVFLMAMLASTSILISFLTSKSLLEISGTKTSDYLNNYINLNTITQGIPKCFRQIFSFLNGRNSLYRHVGIWSVLTVWFGAIYLMIKSPLRNYKGKLLSLSLFLIAGISATGLLFISSGTVPIRALPSLCIIYSFLGAAQRPWTNVVTPVQKVRIFLIGCAVFSNIYISTSLFYSDKIARDRDQILAGSIISRMQEVEPKLGLEPTKFTVVGEWFHERDSPASPLEIFGSSFFSHEGGNPYRIAYYFRLLGVQRLEPQPIASIVENLGAIKKMPPWPDRSSVGYVNNILVLKLSDISAAQNLTLTESK